jgi:hypothetical protein
MSSARWRQQRCRRNAAGHAPALHSVVQGTQRQRAAFAALPLPFGQRGAPGARLAAGRSRERKRKVKSPGCREGQIKGVARRAPPSESARGFAAAPQGVLRVPRRVGDPPGSGVFHVPFAMRCATVRWSLHGWQ